MTPEDVVRCYPDLLVGAVNAAQTRRLSTVCFGPVQCWRPDLYRALQTGQHAEIHVGPSPQHGLLGASLTSAALLASDMLLLLALAVIAVVKRWPGPFRPGPGIKTRQQSYTQETVINQFLGV